MKRSEVFFNVCRSYIHIVCIPLIISLHTCYILYTNYLRKKNNNTSTLLINNLFDYYKDLFEKLNIKVSKDRIFSLDTNNIMEKIFICLENYPEFILSFEKNRNIVLGSIFSNSNKIKFIKS